MKRNLVAAFCLSFCFLSLSAQEQILPEKSFYQSEDGKLYVNKDLPIFVWLSSSKDENAKKVRLFSQHSKQYSNPFYFDTEGINTVRTPSAVDTITKKTVYPETDIVFEVYADGCLPQTRFEFSDQKALFRDGNHWISKKSKLDFKAFDRLSGVAEIYVSIDKKEFKPFQEPIQFSESKEYNIQYYSVDNVGNVELIKELVVMVDAETPVSKLEFTGDKHEDVLSNSSTIKLIAEDDRVGVSEIYYQLDSLPEKKYLYPLKTMYMTAGEHTLRFYSIDLVGNKEVQNTYVFYVDKLPPVVIEELEASTFVSNGKEFSSGRSRFKITAIDNKAGVKEIFYSINGGKYELYEKPFFLQSNSGNLRIKTYAVDHVGNRSSSEQSSNKAAIPYIDLTGPSIKHAFIGKSFMSDDTTFIKNNTKISLTASDLESGLHEIQYNIDNKGAVPFEESFVVTQEGMHQLSFTAYDNVGNTNSKTIYCFVDNVGPEIYERFSVSSISSYTVEDEEIFIYPKHAVLFLSATDKESGLDKITYSLKGGTEKLYSGVIKDFEGDTEYKITIYAFDKLNNKSEKTFKFRIAK